MDIPQHQPVKKDKVLSFEVRLNWLTKHRGILFADDVQDTLHVATPPAFGGEGKDWSPEHLFLGAISSCFMTTYLFFKKRFVLEIERLECSATGTVQLVDGKFQFTHIDLFPKIYVASDAWKEKAAQVLEKTKEHCLVSHSVKAPIAYQSEILIDSNPRLTVNDEYHSIA